VVVLVFFRAFIATAATRIITATAPIRYVVILEPPDAEDELLLDEVMDWALRL